MPNKSQDHVHRLIRSMSPAEKRYFKLHLARNGHEHTSHQQALFDAVAAMERYDEDGLIERFQGAPFTRHFAITKRRLYESILHSLQRFHADSSVDARVHGLLHQVELLHQRALYADAAKVLASARKLAQRHERASALIAARDWERRLIECRNYHGIQESELDALEQADHVIQSAREEVDHLWILKSRLFLRMYRLGAARESESAAQVRELLHDPLLREGATLSTARARFLHHHIRAAAAFALGEHERSRTHLQSAVALLEQERDAFTDDPNLILGAMSNLAFVTVQCGLYEEAFTLLKRYRQLPGQWNLPETEDLDLKLFATTASLELGMHLRLGDAAKALELIPLVERGLERHRQHLGPVRRAALQYECACAHFVAGQTGRALRWINDLLNATRHDDHGDVSRFARLLHLILLHDAGKHELLAYAHRNTERFLKVHGRPHRFEARMLRLVAQLIQAHGDAEEGAALAAFRDDALAILEDPQERVVLDYLDPVAWAISKLKGRPLAECIRERAAGMERAA